MYLFLTLFGGMALTALLYATGRAARLSNFWSAVIGAGVPVLGYFVLAFAARPGLDTITLHLVAYPTVAVLFFLLYGDKARGPRLHWVPLLLVGFFATLVVIMGSFVYIATEGLPPALAARLLPNAGSSPVHTGFAGVVSHQEEAAKSIGSYRNALARLEKLGWQVEISGLDDLRTGVAKAVVVHLTDHAGQPASVQAVRLAWARPGQADSGTQSLTGEGPGGYHVQLPGLDSGTWVSRLEIVPAGDTPNKPILLEHGFTVR